jgi:hypothetical protein
MSTPDGFGQSVDFRSFYKDMDTSIFITEDRSIGFSALHKTLDRKLADLSKYSPQDITLLYSKDFKFNGYNAIALYLYEEHSHHTYVYIAFGDESFHVEMNGRCRADDLGSRDQIVNAFLTANYNRGKA